MGCPFDKLSFNTTFENKICQGPANVYQTAEIKKKKSCNIHLNISCSHMTTGLMF